QSLFFFFSSRRRHTRWPRDWSSDVCSSDLLPGPGRSGHLRLAAELAVAAHLARHPRYFRGEPIELIHHRVDRALQLQDLALHIRSEERRVGKEWISRWSSEQLVKNEQERSK